MHRRPFISALVLILAACGAPPARESTATPSPDPVGAQAAPLDPESTAVGTVASATTTIFVEESPPPPTVVDMERLNDLLPQFDVPAASLSTRASAVLAAAPVEQTISVEPGDATIGTASVCVRLSEPTGGSSAACEPGRSVGFLLGISVTPGDPQNSTIYLAHESTVTVSTDACKVASAPVSDSVSVAACDLADLIGDVELDIVTGAATYRVSVTVPDLDSFKPVGAP